MFRLIAIIIAVTLLQLHWSLGKYLYENSASCLDCLVLPELLLYSLIPSMFIIPLIGLGRRAKIAGAWQIIILTVMMILWWFYINNEIFKDRVSAWSTFTTKEEWFYSIRLSIIPVLVCGLMLSILLKYSINRKGMLTNKANDLKRE